MVLQEPGQARGCFSRNIQRPVCDTVGLSLERNISSVDLASGVNVEIIDGEAQLAPGVRTRLRVMFPGEG